MGNDNGGLKTGDKESPWKYWECLKLGFVGSMSVISDCFKFSTWDEWDDSVDRNEVAGSNCWQLRDAVVAIDECDALTG